MSIIDKIKLNGTTYDVGKIPDTTLTQSGRAADAEAVGNNLNIARSSAVELNPIAYYKHSSDGLSVVDFAEMPLNSYDFAQFSVFKDALLSANFPLLWDDTDYIAIERRAVGSKSLYVSVINLHNFAKKQSAVMLYFSTSSEDKYRWILPSTDFTKQYLPAEAKAVGDALAQKADISSLIAGRNNIVILPWGGISKSDIGDTIDFRTLPLDTYCFTQYAYIKQSLSDTNMPDNDWSDDDYIAIFRGNAHKSSTGNSIITLYNFSKTCKLEMLYYATTSGNKYRWILPSTDFTKQYLPADAKAVGDALAQKLDISSLLVGRSNNVAVVPWGGVAKSDIGDAIDFRTFPLNTYCFTQYSYIKQSLLDTNMPDNDWEDSDYVSMFRSSAGKYTQNGVSIISFYNFTKTRKLEMIYFASTIDNKYRWLTQGVIQNINNDYIYNQYSNSYEITAYPVITSDTNNYLASTDDNTDRTADIVTLLSQTGVCNLGSGVFYVSGIDMPNDSTISGSGSATKIVLLDSVTDGYAIKMGSRCIVKNCTIVGGAGTYSPTSTIGTRYGIVWIGTATPESITSPGPTRGTISNCYIYNFSGSGIYCQGTGTGISNCLNVVNVYIYNCTVGIYIPLLSEFHRFTNVDCRSCYYGTINNGGNNVFANCGFSKNIIGIMIDAKSNSAHGTYSGCVINHSGSNNDGIAIKLINISPKEIFTGCQIYYGSVDIENCKGIVFNACNFGSDIPINITDGKTVLFSSCVFTSQPVITKVNNIYTHFADCYTREDDIVTV